MVLQLNSGKYFPLILLLCLYTNCVHGGFACLSNPCVYGVCLDDLNSTYFCYCIDGFTGNTCNTNWNECWSSPCQNGGICIDGIASFNCSCPPGFIGDLCEEDFNECESNPCANDGTCIDGPNGYTCNCMPGYSGVHCEIDVAVCNSTNETRCSNGGICEEGPGESFTCNCQPGWDGFLCDIPIDECISAPCQNGAVCIDLHADYACACLFGFSGHNCEETVKICDQNPCKNGALCLVEEIGKHCYCVPDFHGELCQYQYDECQLGPRCKNGGTCIDGVDSFTCSCPPNLTGRFCECLIFNYNQLDCSYIMPSTTTTEYTTLLVPTSSSTAIPEITFVPNATITEQFESTITDYSLTTLFTKETFSSSTEYTTFFTTDEEMTTIFPTDQSLLSSESTSSFPFTSPFEENTSTAFTRDKTTSSFDWLSTTQEDTTIYSPSYETTTESDIINTTTEDNFISSIATESTDHETWLTSESTSETNLITIPTIFPTFPSNNTFNFTDSEGRQTITSTIPSFTESSVFSQVFTTTTFMPESTSFLETTTLRSFDCSQSHSHCRNGGTCIYTNGAFQCICPFDSEGFLCEKNLGISNAAFNGRSYLIHRLHNTSHIIIELELRTLLKSGLIYHCSIVDSNYMALFLEDGFLKFIFSCGYQTMLLSELKVPIDNGYSVYIKTELKYSTDYKHCYASLNVNNSLSMTGDQIALFNKLIKPSSLLVLGSLQNELLSKKIPNKGFVGCMKNLMISYRKVSIFKDAENGFGITECQSLACLINPCENGGTCESSGEKYFCSCKNGFLGEKCDISICSNNPCLYGGTCVPFSGNGYLCLCPFGKHGHFCENDLNIIQPYFSSTVGGWSSFAAYPIPGGINYKLEIQFKMSPTTFDQISILLFIGQNGFHDYYSDHLAVSFVKGFIMLTWNLGSGPRRIFTSEPIKKGARDYTIKLGYQGRRAWLWVENLTNITGRSPGKSINLDVVPLLYIGGHDSVNFSILPHDIPLHLGFSGCIFDVEIKTGNVKIPLQVSKQTVGRAVGQCGATECLQQSCQNDGACLHHGSTFMCLCQDDWFGPLCTAKNNFCDTRVQKCSKDSKCIPLMNNYECDCPFGKVGNYCEKVENISTIGFSGKRSFAIVPLNMELDDHTITISLEIKPLKEQGLIFFMGKRRGTYISLSLTDGLVELKVHCEKRKKTPISIRSTKLLLNAVWASIEFGIFGKKIYLSVDGVINTGVAGKVYTSSMSKNSEVFLGGLPDMSNLPPEAISTYPRPFAGCIRNLNINNAFKSLSNNIKESQNLVDCNDTPCGANVCKNGGTCWIDSFKQIHCSCLAPYHGLRCEYSKVCDKSNMCMNNGICKDSRCSCTVGYSGAFCEREINVSTPQFSGKSYLIIRKSGEKKRELKYTPIKSILMNFTTAHKSGMLMWSEHFNDYFGIGFENGYIKISYSKNGLDEIGIPMHFMVSDGLWHEVELKFSPFQLRIDNTSLKSNSGIYDISLGNISISSNGVIFIGNIPNVSDLLSATNGIFPYPFRGCLQNFRINSKEEIINLQSHESADIQSCGVY